MDAGRLPQSPPVEAANLLYQGPWVAERLSSLTNWLQGDPEAWGGREGGESHESLGKLQKVPLNWK